MKKADCIVDIGPGAGTAGGNIVYQGNPEGFLKNGGVQGSKTAPWLSGKQRPSIPAQRRTATGTFRLKGASGNNLRDIDVVFPKGVLIGVCGVSGSGKSSLIVDTLGRILAPRKQTTSVAHEPVNPEPYRELSDPPPRTIIIDQARIGVQTPGVFLGLEKLLGRRYAESGQAAQAGYAENIFARSCTACGGSGSIRTEMAFMPDVFTECETCCGSGYRREAWEISLKGYPLPELAALTLKEIYQLWGDDGKIGAVLAETISLGLGYLAFRQPAVRLSGGEIQRLKIVRELGRKVKTGTLYILDEPTVGQHLEDVDRLVGVLNRLVESGHTVLVVEHHIHFLAACDWIIELGPGAGPRGGRIVAEGSPEKVSREKTATAPYLAEILGREAV
jgi:excinuclease ABC subunit A